LKLRIAGIPKIIKHGNFKQMITYLIKYVLITLNLGLQIGAIINFTSHLKKQHLVWAGSSTYIVSGIIVNGFIAMLHNIFGGGHGGTSPFMLQVQI